VACTLRVLGYSPAVSLSQIEYFVAVAEEGHVGRAATHLRIAQPAVSRQIRHLEDELGTPLFSRTPRGMQLSEAGARFLGHARAILGGVRAAKADVRGIVEGRGATSRT
jgi:DNA-binding transcriptional LysR family regulator